MRTSFDEAVENQLAKLDEAKVIERLWQRDGTLFGDTPAVKKSVLNRLGWLEPFDAMRAQLNEMVALARTVERQEFDRVLVVGMGGSSLWPEVVGRHLRGKRGLPVHIADSTHPEAVTGWMDWADEGKPLFLIATKSGTTVETLSLLAILRQRWSDGQHYVAITDPGSKLQSLAVEAGFRATFLNPPDIGGRFSATSLFGLVPAVLAGVVSKDALERAEQMAEDCRSTTAAQNPAALLAAFLAAAHGSGRWQMRLAASRDVRGFCAWIEQLIAESSGKQGQGVLPVPGSLAGRAEELAAAMSTSVLVSMTTFRYPDDTFARRCEDADVPTLSLVMPEASDLWTEVFRWQMATALLGYLLGVNPFDEPDVSAAKAATSALLQGKATMPEVETFSIQRIADLEGHLADRLAALPAGEHFGLLCYVAPSEAQLQRLESLRDRLQRRTKAAVTVQIGPRYLHSTGQLHKGGPKAGQFLVLHDLDGIGAEGGPVDVPVPDAPFTLGQLIRAQAEGDVMVLRQRDKPVALARLV